MKHKYKDNIHLIYKISYTNKGIVEEYEFMKVTLSIFITMPLLLIQNKLRLPWFYLDVENKNSKVTASRHLFLHLWPNQISSIIVERIKATLFSSWNLKYSFSVGIVLHGSYELLKWYSDKLKAYDKKLTF